MIIQNHESEIQMAQVQIVKFGIKFAIGQVWELENRKIGQTPTIAKIISISTDAYHKRHGGRPFATFEIIEGQHYNFAGDIINTKTEIVMENYDDTAANVTRFISGRQPKFIAKPKIKSEMKVKMKVGEQRLLYPTNPFEQVFTENDAAKCEVIEVFNENDERYLDGFVGKVVIKSPANRVGGVDIICNIAGNPESYNKTLG